MKAFALESADVRLARAGLNVQLKVFIPHEIEYSSYAGGHEITSDKYVYSFDSALR